MNVKNDFDADITQILQSCEYEGFDQCTRILMKKKDVVVYQNEKIDYCYIILSGECYVCNEFSNGRRFILSIIGKGLIIGEMEVASHRSTFVHLLEASKRGELLRVPKNLYCDWLNYNSFARLAVTRLAGMMCRSSGRNGERVVLPAEIVTGLYLLREYRALPMDANGLTIEKTRDAIAESLGLSTRSLQRVIAGFDKERIIDIVRGKITMNSAQFQVLKKKLANYDNDLLEKEGEI